MNSERTKRQQLEDVIVASSLRRLQTYYLAIGAPGGASARAYALIGGSVTIFAPYVSILNPASSTSASVANTSANVKPCAMNWLQTALAPLLAIFAGPAFVNASFATANVTGLYSAFSCPKFGPPARVPGGQMFWTCTFVAPPPRSAEAIGSICGSTTSSNMLWISVVGTYWFAPPLARSV